MPVSYQWRGDKKYMSEKDPTISVVLMTSEGKHDVPEYFSTIEGVADELVVVVTGLVNGAPLIEEHAAKALFPVRIFYYHQPKFHDGATRAYTTEQCRMDYVLQLDSD